MKSLAYCGGPKAVTSPFPVWPTASALDEKALWESQSTLPRRNGPWCQKVAEAFAAYCAVPYVLPVANGTVSLEIILRALGVGLGDEIILPPYTFIATASSILFTRATPVFADIDEETCNLSPEAAKAAITPKTKAIIAVAVGGRPMDLQAFEALSLESGIPLIVDAAQAVGAAYDNRSIASYGIAASFSCQNTKNWTGGEGGFITTTSKEFYEKLLSVTKEVDLSMEESQAALLWSQLQKLPEETARRNQNGALLASLLANCPLCAPMKTDPHITVNAYHLFLVRFHADFLEKHGLDRQMVLKLLSAEGVPITPGYYPLYSFSSLASPYVEDIVGKPLDKTPCPVCETISYREGAWMEQRMLLGTEAQIRQVAEAFFKVSAAIESGTWKDAPSSDLSDAPLKSPSEDAPGESTPLTPAAPASFESVLNEALDSGVWGTVGPYFEKACQALCYHAGSPHALLTSSGDTALLSALRALELAGPDRTVASPPELCALLENAGYELTSNASKAGATLEKVPSLFPEKADAYHLKRGDESFAIILMFDSLGALLTNNLSAYQKSYAYHNCGRIPGVGATTDLSAETIVGGDYRITEWQAIWLLKEMGEID